jgi:hypothetical protein
MKEKMTDYLPTLYAVKAIIQPTAFERVKAWLVDKHVPEVAAEPGFIGAEIVHLDETGPTGEQSLLVIYRLASRAALETYFASPARTRFAQELSVFADVMRAERWIGEIQGRS